MAVKSITMFAALYKKQMRETLPEIVVVASVTVLIGLFVYFKLGSLLSAVAVAMVMVLGLASFLPLISSLRLGQEWNNNTIYLMMSLPVGGGMILGSRLTALLTQYILGTLIVGIVGMLLAFGMFPDDFGYYLKLSLPYWDEAFLLYLLTVMILAYFISISFFSQIIGKLVSRFSGLVTLVTFIGTLWLSGEAMSLLWGQVSIGPPDISTQLLAVSVGQITLVAAVIMTLAVLIYDRRVEL
ncbi:MAG: hypothetical protein ACOXZ6_01455 [Syntrophomonadaceae bacterium]|nr:hypothetical protein [Bacillota bacterium]NLP24505.1 hypothetical protein [Syntrophomonadaceae bacterium]